MEVTYSRIPTLDMRVCKLSLVIQYVTRYLSRATSSTCSYVLTQGLCSSTPDFTNKRYTSAKWNHPSSFDTANQAAPDLGFPWEFPPEGFPPNGFSQTCVWRRYMLASDLAARYMRSRRETPAKVLCQSEWSTCGSCCWIAWPTVTPSPDHRRL